MIDKQTLRELLPLTHKTKAEQRKLGEHYWLAEGAPLQTPDRTAGNQTPSQREVRVVGFEQRARCSRWFAELEFAQIGGEWKLHPGLDEKASPAVALTLKYHPWQVFGFEVVTAAERRSMMRGVTPAVA